jgi:hypothetical protein
MAVMQISRYNLMISASFDKKILWNCKNNTVIKTFDRGSEKLYQWKNADIMLELIGKMIYLYNTFGIDKLSDGENEIPLFQERTTNLIPSSFIIILEGSHFFIHTHPSRSNSIESNFILYSKYYFFYQLGI